MDGACCLGRFLNCGNDFALLQTCLSATLRSSDALEYWTFIQHNFRPNRPPEIPCPTPVSGWFEWVAEGGPRKQPYHIQHADGSPILCAAIGQFPGLDDEPAEQHGFVIITADAEGGMVDIHDRRPVVLSPDLAREWLDPATPPERAEQIALNQGEPSEAFTWYPVSRDVGNVRNQGPQLIEPQRSAS